MDAVDVPVSARGASHPRRGLGIARSSVDSVQGDRPVRLAPACLAGSVAHPH